MSYAVSFTENVPRPGSRVARLMATFSTARADRNERVRSRRTALAMSEEARIHAQIRYRRMRYRHMAG